MEIKELDKWKQKKDLNLHTLKLQLEVITWEKLDISVRHKVNKKAKKEQLTIKRHKRHTKKDNIQVDKAIHIKDLVVLKKVQGSNQVHMNQAVLNFTKDRKSKVEVQRYQRAQKQSMIKEKDLKGINDLWIIFFIIR